MNIQALAGKSNDELLRIIAQMQAQGERKLTLKVSKKGAISLYGMGRFPVTLYASQWDKLTAMADDIRAFAAANAPLLSSGKDDPRFQNVADEQ